MFNNSDDLVLQTIINFKGEWPSEHANLVVAATIKNKDYTEGTFALAPSSFNFSEDWILACTREEFEARLQGFRKAAPEGAEYFAPTHCSPNFDAGWYKKHCDVWFFCRSPSFKWSLGCTQDPIKKRNLIPLPKLAPEPWTPEVGQECEVKVNNHWYSTFIVGFDSCSDLVYETSNFSEMGHFEVSDTNTEFRPLRTEADKEYERLFEEAINVIEKDKNNYALQLYDYRDAVEALIKAKIIK